MPKLYLVRHGETLFNAERRIQGHADSPLTEAGIQQAKQARERLGSVQFAAAYCSDLGRASETARIIVEGRGIELQAVKELREKLYGDWEQLRDEDVKSRFPEDYKRLESDDPDFAPPNAESDNDLVRRVAGFAESIRQAHDDDENVLIVAHGGSLRALLVHYMRVPSRGMWNFVLGNGSVSIIRAFQKGGAFLDLWNGISDITRD